MADKQISIKILTSVVGAEKSAADLKRISSAAQKVTAEQRAANIAAQGVRGGKGSMEDLAVYRSMFPEDKKPRSGGRTNAWTLVGDNRPGQGWPTGNQDNNPLPGADKRGAARIAASQALSRYDAMEAGAVGRAKAAKAEASELVSREKLVSQQEKLSQKAARVNADTGKDITRLYGFMQVAGSAGALLDPKANKLIGGMNLMGGAMAISTNGIMQGAGIGMMMMGGIVEQLHNNARADFHGKPAATDIAGKQAARDTEIDQLLTNMTIDTLKGFSGPDLPSGNSLYDKWKRGGMEKYRRDAARLQQLQFENKDEYGGDPTGYSEEVRMNMDQEYAKKKNSEKLRQLSKRLRMEGNTAQAAEIDKLNSNMMAPKDDGWKTIGAGNRFRQGLSSAEASARGGGSININVSGAEGALGAIIASIAQQAAAAAAAQTLARMSGAMR